MPLLYLFPSLSMYNFCHFNFSTHIFLCIYITNGNNEHLDKALHNELKVKSFFLSLTMNSKLLIPQLF